ncbi:hypothetical protein EauS123_00017 [Exiguobacterium phage vB_EauS-123]|nr:hypothetical protein EauS123_00017 [Exiguobacterium phage vB_EauS-123]
MTEVVGTLIFAALMISLPIVLTITQHIADEKRDRT